MAAAALGGDGVGAVGLGAGVREVEPGQLVGEMGLTRLEVSDLF